MKVNVLHSNADADLVGVFACLLRLNNIQPVIGHSSVQNAKAEKLVLICGPECENDTFFSGKLIELMSSASRDNVVLVTLPGLKKFPSSLQHVRGDNRSLDNLPPLKVFNLTGTSPSHMTRVAKLLADDLLDGKMPPKKQIVLTPQKPPVFAGVKLGNVGMPQFLKPVMSGPVVLASLMALVGGNIYFGVQSNNLSTKLHESEAFSSSVLQQITYALPNATQKEVLNTIADDLLTHYVSADISQLNSDEQARRSRIFHLLGEMYDSNGKRKEAMDSFQRSFELTYALMRSEPNSAQRIFDHSQSAFWLGNSAYKAGHFQPAAERFNDYKTLTQNLIDIEPTNQLYRAEYAHALNNSGIVALERGQLSEATVLFAEAIAGFKNGPIENGTASIHDIANSQGWLADVYEAQGDLKRVASARTEEVNIQRDILASDPSNKMASWSLANALHEQSVAQLNLGQVELAGTLADQAIDLLSELYEGSDSNIRYRRSYIKALVQRAYNYIYDDELMKAQLLVGEIRRVIAKSDVTGADDDLKLARNRIAIVDSEIAFKAAALGDAFINANTALIQSMDETVKGNARNLQYQAQIKYLLGELHLANGEMELAKAYFRDVIERLSSIDQSMYLSSKDRLARSHYHLGDVSTARSLILNLEASGYAHPSFTSFWKRPDVASLMTNQSG